TPTYTLSLHDALPIFSVSIGPASRLRHRCSSRYLRIPPLHREFRSPLPSSSHAVSPAAPELSPGISQVTYAAAYAPFTPSDSGRSEEHTSELQSPDHL